MSTQPTSASETGLPLSGIRVLDFSRLLPGPWCTQLLGDMGAQVIKVEHRDGGDPSRHNPPLMRTNSAYFNSVNGNKRSLTLDLNSAEAAGIVQRLFEWADIVVESFSVGTADKLGVGYEAARKRRPDVIYCSVSGFGQTGELSAIPGHDLVIQAAAGILSPLPDNMPHFQAGDYAAGAMATIAILAALRRRDQSGVGSYLDIAMFDSLMAMGNIGLGPALARASGGTGEPALHVWGTNPRYRIYPTRDGKWVAVCLLETRLWRDFCQVIGRCDLAFENEDPSQRHSEHGERGRKFFSAISAFCLAHDRDEIVALMKAHSLPVMSVATADEALASKHAAQRGIVRKTNHPADGEIVELTTPLNRSGLARRVRIPAPQLGGDTDEILKDIGYTPEQTRALRASNVV